MKFGTFCTGIDACGVAWMPMGWENLFQAENATFPSVVLKYHYPDIPNFGDVTKIADDAEKIKTISRADVVCAGTPCQGFSLAGARKGLADERSKLSLEFGKILHLARPKWFIWENVPNTMSINSGDDFANILGLFSGTDIRTPPEGWKNAGVVQGATYSLAYRVLDARYFGVPQRRRRIFVVGHLGSDWRPPFAVLFEQGGLCRNLAPSRSTRKRTAGTSQVGTNYDGGDIAPTLTTRLHLQNMPDKDNFGAIIAPLALPLQNSVTASFTANEEAHTLDGSKIEGVMYGIPGNWIGRKPQNGGNATEPGYDEAPCLTATDRHAVAIALPFDTTQVTSPVNASNPKFGDDCHTLPSNGHPGAVAINFHNSRFAEYKETDYAGSITSSGGDVRGGDNLLLLPRNLIVRRFTPLEYGRLMGFPDGYTAIFGDKTSDNPQYHAYGNSMAVPVMRWLGQRIEMVSKLMVS